MKIKILLFTFFIFSNYGNSQQLSFINSNIRSYLVNNATITGHLYRDENGNGIQNINEPNLSNVDILLNQSDGSFQIVTTDLNGNWVALVSPGNTTVSIDQNDLPPAEGRIETEGTNPNTVFAVALQTTYAGTDGFFYVGTISGHLYYDTNGNGIQNNPTEPNMPNVTVTVTDFHGNIYNPVSDILGNWTATVGVGLATILVNTTDPDFPTGAIQTEGTNPSPITVIQAANTFSENDGFFNVGTATGHLYFDINGNGTQDTGENNMPNVMISIVDSLGANHNLTTDVNGNWSILLPAGNTTATIITTSGAFPTGAFQTQGVNPTNFIVVTGLITNSGNNGFYNKGIIKGHLYKDLNNNGTQDTAEPNIPNISVKITESTSAIQIVSTNALGNWQATVASGSTTSLIDILDTDFPIGATQTEGTNPTFTNVLSNQIISTTNCGFFLPIDTDGDGIFDDVEIANGTDLNNACDPTHNPGYTGFVSTNPTWQASDCDGDGITNGHEFSTGTDPYNPCSPLPLPTNLTYDPSNPIWQATDCDGDGLTNGAEITLGTNPFLADTDGDGHLDGNEVVNSTNPLDPCSPTSTAGSTNYIATNALWQAADCDGDGILNGNEFNNGTDPFNPCSPLPAANNISYDPTNLIWQNEDCDGDGLTNGQEVGIGTNPFLADTDGDGINDQEEVNNNTNPTDPCSPEKSTGYTGYDATNTIWQAGDCDGDGISNGNEFTNQSDPYAPCSPNEPPGYIGYEASNPIWQEADCDDDGATNGEEYANGTDPYDADDNGMIINNAISPNNDGKNDTFFIKGIEIFASTTLSILNRWGIEVFNATNYANDFNGYSKGRVTIKQDEKLPSGTYFYIFHFTRQDGVQKKLTGYLYIN